MPCGHALERPIVELVWFIYCLVNELNRLMADRPMRTRLKTSAHSAATLFANVDRNRVRQCAHCVLHFHDTSKKGTRRWCSMQLSGNRYKVAAYATRQRMWAYE